MSEHGETSAFNYESVDVSTTAVSITSSVTSGGATKRAMRALITIQSQPIRFRYDGAVPTATEGHHADAGDELVVVGYDDINNFRAIRANDATADSVIKVTLESF